MKKETKFLLLFYLLLVAIKIVLAMYIVTPTEFSDGYMYSKIAREIFYWNSNTLDIMDNSFFPPLYPLLLSPAYIFGKMHLIYPAMKILNALLSALIIFPVFFLAKEFLDSKKSLFITIAIAALAGNLNFSNYIMAENIFYPLAAFFFYFSYKSIISGKNSYAALSGLAASLCFLAKFLGFAFIPLYLIIFLIFRKGYNLKFKALAIHYITALIFVLPYIYIKLSSSIGERSSVFSADSYLISLVSAGGIPMKIAGYFDWIVLYAIYILLASGIIFGVYSLAGIALKDKRMNIIYGMVFISAIITLIMVITNSVWFGESFLGLFSSRLIGRYTAVFLPLLMIMGYTAFNRLQGLPDLKAKMFKPFIIITFLLIIGIQLSLFVLLPLNNQELAYLGIIKYGLENYLGLPVYITAICFAVIFTAMLALIWILKNKGRWLISLGVALIILTSCISYGITAFNAKEWAKSEQYQAGIWLDKHGASNSNILIDEKDMCPITRELKCLYQTTVSIKGWVSYIGFWLNGNVYSGDPLIPDEKTDYIITKRELDKSLLYETSGSEKIRIYQNK